MQRDVVASSLPHRLLSSRIAAAVLLLTASAAGALDYEIRETVPLPDPNTRLVAAGDTDGDGALDLVLAIPEPNARMWVVERDGPSFVTRFEILETTELRGGGLVHDLDGDGWPEIVSGHGSDNTVRIWEADGDNSYVLRHEEALGAKIEGRLQVGDSDLNGLPELIFGREGSPSQVILLEAQGNDSYLRVATLTGPGGNVSTSNVYDMDGDGLPELAMSDDGFNPAIERTRVFENRALVYVEPSELLGVLVLGDTDGNGLGEIIGWDQATRWPRILESTGAANGFVEVYHAAGYESIPVDADADGRLELWRAIDEGSGWRDVLTLGRREGAGVVDIWNSGTLFQSSPADIVDVRAIGDTNDDGRLEIAVQQGAELHIVEALQPDWVWTVPYAEYNTQVPGDFIGPEDPLLGSVRFGISLQNWEGWRGTSGDVLDPYLTLGTTLPVTGVEPTEFLVPGSEYEWQFPDIPDGGDSPGIQVAFDSAIVAVEYTPSFTLARTVSPTEISYPGGPVTVTVDLTPQHAALDGEPLDILNVIASVEGQPDFAAQIVSATPLDPLNQDVNFHLGGAYWSIFDITVGQTYSLQLTLDLQLWETAKAVQYAPLVEGRAWYSASEYQAVGNTVSFPLDYGTWTWETTSEHTWGSRPTTMPRVGLAERVVVTPNSPPVAMCQNVEVTVGAGESAAVSIDAGSHDPDGDPVELAQDPPSPYGVGVHQVTLTVDDGFGASNQCSSTVTVNGPPPPPVTLVVTTVADSGPGSLRDAIDQANGDGGATLISFDPSLFAQTIHLADPLPWLIADGTAINGDMNGDCVPDIAILGDQVCCDGGIYVASSDNTIRGLAIGGFPNGIVISPDVGIPADNNVVECNYLGTDLSGTVAVGNEHSGVEVRSGAMNQVGPDNVIAFNGGSGVAIFDGLLDGYPDFEGLTPDFTHLFTTVDFSSDCAASFSSADGVVPVDGDGGEFRENFGALFTGTLAIQTEGDYEFVLPYLGDLARILVDGQTVVDACCGWGSGTVHLAPGDHPFELGYVKGLGQATLRLEINGLPATTFLAPGLLGEFFQLRGASERNTVTENSMFENGELGIELHHPGCDWGAVTPNDPGDADKGANTLLNFPEWVSFIELDGDSFDVTGTAPPESKVELFAAAADYSGHGEGKEFLGAVTAGLAGDFSATVDLPPGYLVITATSTDLEGNTSEFSRNLGLRSNEISVDTNGDGGPGSLREAVEQANSDGGPTIITFDPSLAGSIQLQSELPALTESETTIDGDLDDDCMPDIELDGSAGGGTGLQIFSSSNLIQGLVIHSFGNDGVLIAPWAGLPADNNVLECNFIGTDPSGTTAMPNGGAGISIQGQAANNRIGGAVASSRNVISGNQWVGVSLSGVQSNTVEGNYIGTDVSGAAPLGNHNAGVQVDSESWANQIGPDNVISANGGNGVSLWSASGTNVEGNYIGTDPTGTIALGNQDDGILAAGDCLDNRFGPDNVIAFNLGAGVTIQDSLADDWWDFDSHVAGFVDVFPLIDLSAEEECSRIENSDGIIPDDGSGGFIEYYSARFSGTVNVGTSGDYTFELPDFNGGFNLEVDGNGVLDGGGTIWTGHLDAGAHSLELWYFLHHHPGRLKLDIFGAGAVSLSTDGNIGGCSTGQSGVCGEFYQRPALARRNTVTQNSIFDNQGLGIGLLTCGQWGSVTPNDPGDGDDGPNDLLNFPELTGFMELGGDDYQIAGTATAGSTVELFAVDADESGHGEGKEYLGTVPADPTGGQFVATVSLPSGYFALTTTATDLDGNTSEFSSNLILRPNEVSVENANPEGPGSLQDAVWQANNDGAVTVISFEGVPAGSTIELIDSLELNEDGTVIDGDLDGDCWPDIELSGEFMNDHNGIRINSSNNLVRGLVINRMRGPAIEIGTWNRPVSGNVVECNFIGTDQSGTIAMGNESGVYLLDGPGTFGNRIGGPAATSRNLLSGNYDAGVYIWADGNIVEGNLIGTDITGTQPLGNGNEPVVIEGASDNRIGPANVMAFNGRGVGVADSLDWRYPDFDGLTAAASGVFEVIDFSGDCITFANADGFVLTDEGGNPLIQHFGALFTGTLDVSGGDYTFELLEINDLVSVTVDGETILEEWCCGPYESTLFLDAGSHYLEVAYLQWDSSARLTFDVTGPGTVSLSTDQNTGGCPEGEAGLCGEFFELRLPAERNTITTNSIFGNQGLGISLPGCQGESVPNDPGDVDTGPNGHMNFPEVVSALADAGATVVVGSLETPSAELATIELFANEIADPSGYGEGQTWLGSLQPDALGAFSVTLPEVPVGLWITATATDRWGNTSEFSSALRVSETVRWATALYAAAQSSTSVQLTWIDPGYGETGFRVERSEDGETWVAVATVGHDDVGYLDETLVPATLYYYRVVALDAAGDLRPSNRASATTFPATAAKVCHQQVSTTHSGAALPSAAWNGTSWAVAWQDRRDGLYDELYFQLLDATGAPAGAPVRITETDAISQLATLRWNGSSFALIYGEHMRRPDGEFWSIQKFARLDAQGQPIKKDVLLDPVQLTWGNNQFDETLVWDGTHWGWFVSKDFDHPAPGPTRGDIAFYRLTEDGEIVLGPVRLTDTPEFEIDLAAAWNGNEYGLSWQTGDAVYFQRLAADGATLDAPRTLAGPGLPYVLGTSVAWDGTGWAVAWSEAAGDSEAVMLQLLDPDGATLGPPQRVSDDYDLDFGPGYPVYDEYPQIVVRPGGGYAIYTLSYLWGSWSYEIARLDADANGNRVGQRRVYSDADGRHSAWNRVATNGAEHLVTFNEPRSGSQEIAALLVDDGGAVVAGPAELTTGHDPGAQLFYPVGAGSSWVVPVGEGYAALWDDSITGSRKIHASIYDGAGAPVTEDLALTPGEVSSAPVAAGVGNSFAVAWQDAATGQVFFDRFDAAGTSLLGGVALDGYGQPSDLGFSGEAYGVAWSEGGGVRLQHVLPDGALSGPPIALDGAGSAPFRIEWVGAGWAVVSRAWPDLYYTLLSVDGEQLVPPTRVTTEASDRARWVDLEWTGQHLGVTWEADGDEGREIWFEVIGLDGVEAFHEVSLWSNGRWPSVFWQDGAFRVVFAARTVFAAGNREITVLPDGTVTGNRTLSGHNGFGHAAGNGATAGFLWTHRGEAYFETLACLDDSTPASGPSLTGWFDGTKVRLDWTAVDDPESTVIGYNLYRDGALIAENFATTFSFDDYGMVPDALYVYELRAVNGAWLESAGGAGIETVATAETVEGVGGLLEEVSTQAFEQVIEGILADPEIPDAIADDIQASLDDLIGNNGGLAANGASDKLEKANIVAALSMMRHAIDELQSAAAQGYDTTDLQDLVTSFARLSVLTVIRIEAETLGDGHPDIVAARDLVEQGDALKAAGDYLGAIDLYKDAVQALP